MNYPNNAFKLDPGSLKRSLSGKKRALSGSSKSIEFLTDQELDKSSNLYNYDARLYDPVLGRFVSADSIVPGEYDPQMLNRYAYNRNNPLKYIDPNGHAPVSYDGKVHFDKNGKPVVIPSPLFSSHNSALSLIKDPAFIIGAAFICVGLPQVGIPILIGDEAAVSSSRVASKATLAKRADAVHEVLDPIAKGRRTTAVLETTDGTRIVAGGARDLTPAQRGSLVEGEVAAKMPGAHAETTAIEHAKANGLTPSEMSATREICPDCVKKIEEAGGTVTSPTTANWPPDPPPGNWPWER